MGYRFRLHRRDLPGTPDIVLPSRSKAIFVHGCFWHAHGCRIGGPPKSNSAFWEQKLARNRARDAENAEGLRRAGWDVITVWQCEIKDRTALEERLRDFLGQPGKNSIDFADGQC
jgi:DNA mismatch endonuclease (patch repair protein)